MMTHDLKTHLAPFKAIWQRKKMFEIRLNDRGFQVGHYLRLREYDHHADTYTGRMILTEVTHMIQGEYGLPADLCVMSIRVISRNKGEF